MTTITEPYRLRRTVRPYVGQIVILLAVFTYELYILTTHFNRNMLQFTAFSIIGISALFGMQVYFFGLKYRIFWGEDAIRQQASGGPDVCMRFDEIARIAVEVSSPQELAAASRPFRRIAIYAKPHAGVSAFIDVSLKHFDLDDVRKLMHAIHDHRPDIVLPNRYVK